MLQNAEEVVMPQSKLLGTEEDANDSEQCILQLSYIVIAVLGQQLLENNEEIRVVLVERNGSVMSKKEQKGNKLLGNFKKLCICQTTE